MSQTIAININSFNVSIVTATDDEPKILAWLSPLEPQVQRQDIYDRGVDGIGSWLLGTKESRSWYNVVENSENDHAALFCNGDPGVGKRYIWHEGPSVRNKQGLLVTAPDGSSVVVDYLCNNAVE